MDTGRTGGDWWRLVETGGGLVEDWWPGGLGGLAETDSLGGLADLVETGRTGGDWWRLTLTGQEQPS